MTNVLRVMQDSSTTGAGYEQGLKSGADELVQGGKAAKKKVGATINKKANTGGKQVLPVNSCMSIVRPRQCRAGLGSSQAGSLRCFAFSIRGLLKGCPILVCVLSCTARCATFVHSMFRSTCPTFSPVVGASSVVTQACATLPCIRAEEGKRQQGWRPPRSFRWSCEFQVITDMWCYVILWRHGNK